MLLSNYYLKNYLLGLKLVNEKNFFFIIENLCNLNKLYLKSFLLLKKNKLYIFSYKGKFYYLNYDKKFFLNNLVLLIEFIKLDLIKLNGVIYNNYYLNLNDMNVVNILTNFYSLNYNIIFLFINIIVNINVYLYFFLLKLLILIKENVKIYRK